MSNMTYCKIHVIFYNKITKWNFFQNNAIAGVPRPGPYYIHNYFSNAHPIFCIINYLRFDKITFSMILIKYQLVHVNTTTILHLYDDRH